MQVHINICITILYVLCCVKVIYNQDPLCSNLLQFDDYGDVRVGRFQITLNSSERENYVEVVVFVANKCKNSLCGLTMGTTVNDASKRYESGQQVPYIIYFRHTSADAWVNGIALRTSKGCKVICWDNTDAVDAKTKAMKHVLYMDGQISSQGFACDPRTIFVSPTPEPPTESDATCGVASSNFSSDKKEYLTRKELWPWLAAISRNKNNDFDLICGGTIVSKRVVLTAALCFHEPKPPHSELSRHQFYVFLGLIDFYGFQPGKDRQYALKDILKHPNYDPTSGMFDADIAILIMTEDITYSPTIRPACIWDDPSSIEVKDVGIVVGWGINETTSAMRLAKKVRVTVSSNDQCEVISDTVSDNNFCTTPCEADSGGGFFMKHSNVWKLRGIITSRIAAGESLCETNNTAVYAEVSNYIDWIKDEINKY